MAMYSEMLAALGPRALGAAAPLLASAAQERLYDALMWVGGGLAIVSVLLYLGGRYTKGEPNLIKVGPFSFRVTQPSLVFLCVGAMLLLGPLAFGAQLPQGDSQDEGQGHEETSTNSRLEPPPDTGVVDEHEGPGRAESSRESEPSDSGDVTSRAPPLGALRVNLRDPDDAIALLRENSSRALTVALLRAGEQVPFTATRAGSPVSDARWSSTSRATPIDLTTGVLRAEEVMNLQVRAEQGGDLARMRVMVFALVRGRHSRTDYLGPIDGPGCAGNIGRGSGGVTLSSAGESCIESLELRRWPANMRISLRMSQLRGTAGVFIGSTTPTSQAPLHLVVLSDSGVCEVHRNVGGGWTQQWADSRCFGRRGAGDVELWIDRYRDGSAVYVGQERKFRLREEFPPGRGAAIYVEGTVRVSSLRVYDVPSTLASTHLRPL